MVNNNSLPTITTVIATYNSQNTIELCLSSLRSQDYPQEKVDIVIVDGSSKDSTLEIAKKFQVKIVTVPPRLQNAEYNKSIGLSHARGELVLMIDHDNVLPHKRWLSKMVEPLLRDKDIVAVEPLRYHYDSSYSFLDRYFALLGIGDPLAFYLGKADRLSYLYDKYCLFGKAEDKGDYFKVKFDPSSIPTLGANGYIVRRKILIQNASVDTDHFFHIDVNVDLIKKGINTYAFIKDDIIHFTGYKSIWSFLYRRKLFMEQFHIKTHSKRRYSVYQKQDTLKLLYFILIASTFVKPFFDAARGFRKIPDSAWFLHPFLCFTLLVIYSSVTIKNIGKHYG